MSVEEFESVANRLADQRVPFLFLIDFEMQKPLVLQLHEIETGRLLYDINGVTNATDRPVGIPTKLDKSPIDFDTYTRKFETVYRSLAYGDSYLANLTVKTEVRTSASMRELFYAASAKYKLWFNDKFLVFSPEIFVQVRAGRIYAFPMKGTIDAAVPSAREKILSDNKEIAEHVTIVDLIRNDLSLVATNVRVERFRYVDELRTSHKTLLQVSSEIVGDLHPEYRSRLGSMLLKLLPAGSVSGAPKKKTIEIIRSAENEERGYYTGIVGYFDGTNFDSGVMIRFMEREGDKTFFRSGGGITARSEASREYQEVIDKVYVPFD